MSEEDRPDTLTAGVPPAPPSQLAELESPPPDRPKLKKRRLLLLLIPLVLLAGISTVFGMMMAVAQRPARTSRARRSSRRRATRRSSTASVSRSGS